MNIPLLDLITKVHGECLGNGYVGKPLDAPRPAVQRRDSENLLKPGRSARGVLGPGPTPRGAVPVLVPGTVAIQVACSGHWDSVFPDSEAKVRL